MPPIKTYFLAPTRDIPPTGPIYLGALISSPSHPKTVLSAYPKTIPPTTPIYTSYQTNWSATIEKHRGGRIGLWLQFLQMVGIGTDLSVNYSCSNSDVYKFDRLETQFFNPSTDYVRESVLAPDVQDYIVKNKYRENVYMVTGIKVARGASVASTTLRERGIHTQFGVDGAAAGVPLSIGPAADVSKSRKHEVKFEGGSDFVFAFRLKEIYYTRKREVRHKAYVKGALFNLPGSDEEEDGQEIKRDESKQAEEVVKEVFELVGLAAEDLTADDLGLESTETVDEDDDEKCECVVLKDLD